MKTKQRHSGQSLVEFALIIPIAFFLITGFFDLGRAVFNYSSLTNVVRKVTRYAIVHKVELTNAFDYPLPADNLLQRKVMDEAEAFGMTLNRSGVDVIVTKENNFFTKVSIRATYRYQPITPGIQALLGGGVDIMAYSKMYVTPGSR